MIESVARWAYRHRRLVLTGWLVAVIGMSTFMSSATYSRDFQTPGESQRALDLLERRFPAGEAGDSIQLVFQADRGVDDPAVKQRIGRLLDDALGVAHVETVISPYDPEGSAQVAPGKRAAFATVQLDVSGFDVPASVVDDLTSVAADARSSELQIELGGQAVRNAETSVGNTAEMVGFLVALVIMVVAFGSIVAAALPIVMALLGLGVGMAAIALSTKVTSIPEFAPQLAAMVGIGVGIDYALFIVTRYREALASGQPPADAIHTASTTAGRAIVVAGSTVVASLLGVLVFGDETLRGLGVATALVVLTMTLASATLLPAGLGLAGRRIDALSWRRRRAAPDAGARGWSHRWVCVVQRHPVVWAVVSAATLIALALPVFSMRLGAADAGNGPTSASSRKAYEMLADGFGPGFNAPLLVVTDLTGVAGGGRGPAGVRALQQLRSGLAGDANVAAVAPPRVNTQGDAAVLTIFPRSSPQDEATDNLVWRLRSTVIPASLEGSVARAYVGGQVAGAVDNSARTVDRLPWLFGVVIGLALLLLLLSFRSVVLPVKAAVMNLLAITAAYGVLVAVFQWGWGIELLGLSNGAPIEWVQPLLMFAIIFGLSMDYEVFLLARVREQWQRTGDNREAVAFGVGATARVIAAAAAIMIAVFAAFMLGSDRLIKLFGFGMAVPILVDVLLVRLILAPALMDIFGRANWYIPAWLDRILPRFSIEGRPAASGAATAHAGGGESLATAGVRRKETAE